jgi:hypothetical protein
MAAINSPWSFAGQNLAARLAGLILPAPVVNMPKLAMAGGGAVGELPSLASAAPVNLYISVQKLDEATVRREVIPILERYNKQRA